MLFVVLLVVVVVMLLLVTLTGWHTTMATATGYGLHGTIYYI